MKNTNTTLELPEGSKATIQGKEIDGKYYLVVEVENEEQELKEGDLAIFWDANPKTAFISVCGGFNSSFRQYVDSSGICWFNAIKWDGTKEQYEKVLRGEL